jgi:hypothetical protein
MRGLFAFLYKSISALMFPGIFSPFHLLYETRALDFRPPGHVSFR